MLLLSGYFLFYEGSKNFIKSAETFPRWLHLKLVNLWHKKLAITAADSVALNETVNQFHQSLG